jgi:hypothetical protein
MVLVHMFPPRSGVIPYISPSGGGRQPDGRKNPAWDWRGYFAAEKDGEGIAHMTMRAIYKKFDSDEDIVAEYRKWAGSRLPSNTPLPKPRPETKEK